MSRYSGPMYKGAARESRTIRRDDAERRNEATPGERTRRYRRETEAAEQKAAAL